MTTFKKTAIPKYPRAGSVLTPDTKYWNQLNFPITIKEFGAITHIDFSPVEPYYFAVTNSTRVQVYSPLSNQVYRAYTRFKEAAYGGSFRNDGKLLVAGGDEGIVRVFDISSKNALRMFRGHEGPVHCSKFLNDNLHLVSYSDDKSICVWDIPSESKIQTFQEHKDYIRCGTVSSASQEIFLSGSYDHKVKMFDIRTPNSVLSVDHGSPVEAVLMFPSGGVFISAGGPEIKVWDALAGGRLLAKVTQHHKTVTSLGFASEGQRLLSGSLDRHIKIYDVTTYQVVHSMDYSSSILSLGVSPDDKVIAVGMTTGLLSIQHRKQKHGEVTESKPKHWKHKASYRFLLEAQAFTPTEVDIVVKKEKKSKLLSYDKYLKRFDVSKALDCVLKAYKERKDKPEVVVAVLQELIRRGAIFSALAGRTPQSLCPILFFLQKNISDLRFMRILTDVANILLDLYLSDVAENHQLIKMLVLLQRKIRKEISYMKETLVLKGTIEILFAGYSNVQNQPESFHNGD